MARRNERIQNLIAGLHGSKTVKCTCGKVDHTAACAVYREAVRIERRDSK